MNFKKQRLTIALVFILIPLVSALALAQSSHLSKLLFDFAIKLANIRTGLFIRADSWDINPLQFSASLRGVEVKSPSLKISTQLMKVKVSPLMLLSGKLHFRELLIHKSTVEGSLKTASSTNKKKKNTSMEISSFLSHSLKDFNQHIEKRNISFEKISIKKLDLKINAINAKAHSLLLVNLGNDQFRFDADFSEISLIQKIAPMKDCRFSLITIKENPKTYFIALRNFQATLEDKATAQLTANGRIPGVIEIEMNSHLSQLEKWLQKGSLTNDHYPELDLTGHFSWKGELEVEDNNLESFSGDFTFNDLIVSKHALGRIEGSVRGTPQAFDLVNTTIKLPRSSFETKNHSNSIEIEKLNYSNKEITGIAKFQETGLCAVLWASDLKECHVSLVFSGQSTFSGTLSPFLIQAEHNLELEPFKVYSTPLRQQQMASEEIVFVKPAVMKSQMTLHSKFMEIQDTSIHWDKKNSINTTGKIDYKPTEVNLDVNSEKIDFHNILYDLLDVPIKGLVNIHSSVFYSRTIPKKSGRTRVISKFSGNNFNVLGQNLGFISSDVSYINNTLQVGPAKIYSGEGQALLFGKLSQRNKKSWLEVDALFDKYELNISSSDEKVLPYFQAPLEGKGSISGYIDSKSPETFQGNLRLKVDTINSFGIPFDSADLDATVKLSEFKINSLKATKENAQAELTGSFSKNKSEIFFKSTPVNIKNIGYLPEVEENFNKGKASFKGFWNSENIWEINGDIKGAKFQNINIESAKLLVRGQEESSQIQFSASEKLNVKYQNANNQSNIEAKAKNEGIKLALAFLNGSKISDSFQSKGELSFNDTKSSGSLQLNNVVFLDKNKTAPLLEIKGNNQIEWKDNKFTQPTLIKAISSHSSFLNITPSNDQFLISGKIDNSLLNIFLPEIFLFQAGQSSANGHIQLPLSINNVHIQGNFINSTLLIPALGKPVQDLNSSYSIKNGKFALKKGRAKLGNGEITAYGTYDIKSPLHPVDFYAKIKQGDLVINENVPITASGQISLKGAQTPYSLSGRLNVLQGIYSVEYNQTSQTTVSLEDKESLAFNLDINIAPDFKILNSLMNGQISGRMRLIGSEIIPKFIGKINLVSGKIFAKDNEFNIDRGYLVLSSNESEDASVNIEARSLKTYNDVDYSILMLASGPISQMNLKFSAEPTLTTNEIVSLLTFGYIPQEDNRNSQGSYLAQNAGIEAFQMLFGKAIGSSINKKTGFDVKVGTQSDLQQKESIPKVTVVRRLSKKTTATFGRSLDLSRPENNFKIDYKLLKNMNLTGVWENPEKEKHSLGADIRFKFDIK